MEGAKEWRKGDQYRFYMGAETIGDLAGHKPSTSQRSKMSGTCFDVNARCWRPGGVHSSFMSATSEAIRDLTGFDWDSPATEWEEAKSNPLHGMSPDGRLALAKLYEQRSCIRSCS